MTDKEKLEAIRAEIHRLIDVRGYDKGMANDLFAFMDSLPNEPVSEDLEKEIGKVLTDYYGTRYDDETTVELSAFDIVNIAHHFAKWGKNQAKVEIQAQSMALAHGCPKEPVSEDLEEAARRYAALQAGMKDARTSEYYEEYPYSPNDVNAFKVGANWQFNQLEKNRLKHCNSITNEQAELEQGFIDQHLDKHQRMPTFLDAIEYGMRLQKEQDIKHGYVTFLQGEKHFANYILEMINSGWHIVAIKTACNDKIKED